MSDKESDPYEYKGTPPEGEDIEPDEWEAAGLGAWPMSEAEVERAKCLEKERERGVRRISENLSIVPGSLVEELRSRMEAGENVLIHCGRVITLDQFLNCASKSIVVEIRSGGDGKNKIVTVDGIQVEGVPTGEDEDGR